MTTSARSAATLISLGLLGAAAQAVAAPKEDCRLTQLASLDLVLRESVLVPVTLNGHAGYMELDLGGTTSTFYQGAVDPIGLPHRKNARLGFYWNGVELKEAAKFDSLVLGKANFTNGEFVLMPIPDAGDTFGSLGMSFFAPVDVELDLRHKRMNLFSQDHCRGEVVYWSETFASVPLRTGVYGDLYFDMELEGKKVTASWSPDLSTSTLTTDTTKRLFGFDENSPGVEVERDAAGASEAHYRAMQLTAPGLTATNTKIVLLPPRLAICGKTGGLIPTNIECMDRPPLSLGRNMLEELRLYFATKERVLYFTAADEPE